MLKSTTIHRIRTPTLLALSPHLTSSLFSLLSCSLSLFYIYSKVCESLFIKALYWSVGAAVDGASRSKFDDYIRLLLNGDSVGNDAHNNFMGKNRDYDQESFAERKVCVCMCAGVCLTCFLYGVESIFLSNENRHTYI